MSNNLNQRLVPVILCGGSGTRLWPLSRKQYPKQYLPLHTNNTLLQETILRLQEIPNVECPIIIANCEHRFLVAEQCRDIGLNNPIIILEPEGKNTAPAIVAGAFQAKNKFENCHLLILPADHYIKNVTKFYKAIDKARKQAANGALVTFGVSPVNPNTNYGYIKYSNYIQDGVYKVEKFTEIPDLITAQFFLDQKNYLWNSGIFLFDSDVFLQEMLTFNPKILNKTKESLKNSSKDLDFIRLEEEAFAECPSDSIDYCLMEKSDKTTVIQFDVGWNDIGSWNSLFSLGKKDSNNNVIKGDIHIEATTNSYINSNHHLVVTLGVDNLVVINTPDATLISSKEMADDLKNSLSLLPKKNREELYNHRKVYRPWGWFDVIDEGNFYKVKRLYVKPGGKLSYQYHKKRSEHWTVVDGVATIRIEDRTQKLTSGESIFIAQGEKHSLANNSKNGLEIIEVQSGKYFGEDDIIRINDIYGRLNK